MEEHMIIEGSDYSKQGEVKRTIVDLIDVETGEFVNAIDILTEEKYRDKAVFAKMKETLVLAQKTGIHKYVCAICNQPVRLNSRQYPGRDYVSNFFSHFSHSDECPAKTSSTGSISAQTKILVNNFKRSDIHAEMSSRFTDFLKVTPNINDLRFIHNPDESHTSENMTSDIEFTFQDSTRVGIDFQLYTTFTSKIFEKSFKSKKANRCSMWIFPFFSPTQQAICARDIYYGNRRNVFVFDSREYYTNNVSGLNSFRSFAPNYPEYKYAQEESEKQNKLILNCFWQIPTIQDGKLKIEWRNKLVSLEELTFDLETGDIFYHDSDEDFKRVMDSELYASLLKWEEEVRIRWEQFENTVAKREEKQNYDPNETAEQRKIRILTSRIENGERLIAFRDKSINKIGFKLGDVIIIKPQFHKVWRFDENNVSIIQLSPNGKIGAINLLGKRVFNVKYEGLGHLVKDLYVYKADNLRGLISLERGEILPAKYLGFKKLTEDRILIHNGYYKKVWGSGWDPSTRSYEYYLRGWEKIHKGYRIADLNGEFISKSYNIIRHISEDYLYAEEWKGQLVLLDVDGNVINPDFKINLSDINIKINAIGDELVFLSYDKPDEEGNKSKVCSFTGDILYTSKEYDKVLPFDDVSFEAFCDKRRLLISKTDGGIIAEFE